MNSEIVKLRNSCASSLTKRYLVYVDQVPEAADYAPENDLIKSQFSEIMVDRAMTEVMPGPGTCMELSINEANLLMAVRRVVADPMGFRAWGASMAKALCVYCLTAEGSASRSLFGDVCAMMIHVPSVEAQFGVLNPRRRVLKEIEGPCVRDAAGKAVSTESGNLILRVTPLERTMLDTAYVLAEHVDVNIAAGRFKLLRSAFC